MNTKISMFASFPPTYLSELRRQVWGSLFGRGIQEARNEIKSEEQRVKRMNLNVPIELHRGFKSVTASPPFSGDEVIRL